MDIRAHNIGAIRFILKVDPRVSSQINQAFKGSNTAILEKAKTKMIKGARPAIFSLDGKKHLECTAKNACPSVALLDLSGNCYLS